MGATLTRCPHIFLPSFLPSFLSFFLSFFHSFCFLLFFFCLFVFFPSFLPSFLSFFLSFCLPPSLGLFLFLSSPCTIFFSCFRGFFYVSFAVSIASVFSFQFGLSVHPRTQLYAASFALQLVSVLKGSKIQAPLHRLSWSFPPLPERSRFQLLRHTVTGLFCASSGFDCQGSSLRGRDVIA